MKTLIWNLKYLVLVKLIELRIEKVQHRLFLLKNPELEKTLLYGHVELRIAVLAVYDAILVELLELLKKEVDMQGKLLRIALFIIVMSWLVYVIYRLLSF